MKESRQARSLGFTFLEVIVVMTVLGASASMAIPHYAAYSKKAEAASCLSNRRNIEMDERSYYIENNTPKLEMGGIYTCPSGGVYVWLVSTPQNEHYPLVGCSIHYAGLELLSPAPTTTTTAAPTTTTSLISTTTVMPATTTTTTIAPATSTSLLTTTTTITTTSTTTTTIPQKGKGKGRTG